MTKEFPQLDTSSWENYKASLGKAVNAGHHAGLDDEQISTLATGFGNYLHRHAHADLKENQVLNELWQVADEQEKKAISHLLVKLVQK